MTCIVVMGVAGCGKSTVGAALADELGWTFVEGDDLHPPGNVAKMASGTPLVDEDRWPWLDGVVAEVQSHAAAGASTVVTCSALKRSYRDRLAEGIADPTFVFLGIDEVAAIERLEQRTDHYMGVGMVASQLEALEPPGDDEAIVVDARLPPEEIVSRIVGCLD